MQVGVAQLDIQSAGLNAISIGQVAIGPITVGELVVNNADFSMSAAQGVLQNVSVTVTLHISFTWHVHVGLFWPFDDIDIGDTYDVGTTSFGPVTIGTITIPGLNNVHINIPSLTAQNMSVSASPLSLQLRNAAAEQIHAHNVALPSAGFTIAGLTVSSVQGNTVSVPAAKLDQATVGHLHGDPVSIPSFTLGSLNLPAAHIPTVSSSAPLDIPANLPAQTLGPFPPGTLLQISLTITPSALSHVDHLEITGADASATVGQVVLHNVTLPYDVLNLTLSQVGINTIGIPAFTVS